MLFLEERHRQIILGILRKYPYEFYAFGSRTKAGKAKKFSDLDLCFFDSIPSTVQFSIKEDFEESDLPFTVDLVAWESCSNDFKNLIKDDLVLIKK